MSLKSRLNIFSIRSEQLTVKTKEKVIFIFFSALQLQMKMEDTSVSGLDNSKLEAIAHEIYTELVEDACLGLCFEVYHGVKCSNFYLDDKTHAAQDTQTSFMAVWDAPHLQK